MTCFYPLTAYRLDNGEISFNEKGKTKQKLSLPCGQCQGCRLERSRSWAIRCIHEAKMHKENCFITLTYNDENQQYDLIYSHFQKFLKRLRKKFPQKNIRYYMAGEYGEQTHRPHFHACLFGIDFSDKRLFRELPSGSYLYTSKLLEQLWPFGYSTIGDVTFESAAYVARYVMKKVTGPPAADHYQVCCPNTGELKPITPEFNRMSLKPGIGKKFLEKYLSDIYPNGTIIHNGSKQKPPRFYEKYYAELQPLKYEALQYERLLKVNYDDQTKQRLSDAETVLKAKLTHKKRGFQK